MDHNFFIWLIAALSTAGVIIRPWQIPEAVWALAGSVLLISLRLLQPTEAWEAVLHGLDVYLFLTGMMLLAELAREEKLFDWLAAYASNKANGSPGRLFMLIYAVGVMVTIFLSNDATAVVLTPAVMAVMKAAKIKNPLPYLFICAFVANAASFVLPISNPANLVVYGSQLPSLTAWLPAYLLPSVVSITVTFVLLRWLQRGALAAKIAAPVQLPALPRGARLAAVGIVMTMGVLLASSGLGIPLGLPTFVSGLVITCIILLVTRKSPRIVIAGISWSVLLLVAGLFIIVASLDKTGLIHQLSMRLQQSAGESVTRTAWISGLLAAFGSNLTNNLPSGLVAGQVVQSAPLPEIIRRCILIGIDLGPNLSITGSLATLLWLLALRREGIEISAWTFLKLGMLIMTGALLASLAIVLL